jgi:hypothetical protein
MKKFIVTTTINSPTEATLKFANNFPDWTLIVVGDLKTPHEEYEKINCIYLHPDYQESEYKELSDAIGWKCIQRRNIGFCEAYKRGAEIVATVDDDNIPYDNWGMYVVVGDTLEVNCYESENGYFDPMSVTNYKDLWHRGYPIQHVKTKNNVKFVGKVDRKVMVQADLWDGDPDIDAMCRIPNQPCVDLQSHVFEPFCTNDIAPFNSQNTFIHRDALPYYMVIPHLGRMDDIWGGYLLQEHFGDGIVYCPPTVYQERNDHDLIKDLEGEIIGYRHTLDFIEGKYELPEKAQLAYDIYRKTMTQIASLKEITSNS